MESSEVLRPLEDWRNGGHRGPLTSAQKKKKAKSRKKKK